MTIHGRTPLGEMTLMEAQLDGEQHQSGAGWMQVWHAFQLLHGGHALDSQPFTEVHFSLPHLLNWIGPSRLNCHTHERFRVTRGEYGTPQFAKLDENFEIALGVTDSSSFHQFRESWEAHASYTLTGPEGVTLQQFERVSLALASLHSILANHPMETFQVTLLAGREMGGSLWRLVDARPPAGEDWSQRGHPDLFFDTSEIEFSNFITAWMGLWDTALAAVALAVPTSNRQPVQSKLMDICSGLETLAVLRWKPPELTADEESILTVLEENRINSRMRRRVKSGLRMSNWPLEDKLVQLAGLFGSESSTWLLGPSVRKWAHLVARLRNSLAHGSPLTGGLSDDHHFVTVAFMSASAVLRLALLASAGFTNRSSETPGELLWAGGKRATGHPNSPFFHSLESVARYAGHWETWSKRLEGEV